MIITPFFNRQIGSNRSLFLYDPCPNFVENGPEYHHMNIHYSIQDFMAKDLITFKPNTLIGTAIESILNHKISGAPVVDENGKLGGQVSRRNILKAIKKFSK